MGRFEDDEDWEAEAVTTFTNAAESEFSRLKHSLKVKAGLIKLPWYTRLIAWFKSVCN